jgi:hypothetical protein
MSETNESKQLLEHLNSIGVSDQLITESGLKLSKSRSNNALKYIAQSFETNESLEKAIAHKNKMLEFDQNSSVRTKVIDDENDYFSLSSQNWISHEKRKDLTKKVEQLHENKYKKNKKILIDLMEKTATDYEEPVIKDFDEKVQQLYDESVLKSDYQSVDASDFINEDNKKLQILLYVNNKKPANKVNQNSNIAKSLSNSYNNMRIQDKELMTMSDEGMCLSVNQPFASLLAFGIKRFEGRKWYSPFRGRLWIHASSKKPTEDNIKEVEQFYGFAGVTEFPSYPTSALLGCVTVTECLPFEEFKQLYPDGDTEADYIFVCEDPKQLIKPFPMSGAGNKIYKLDEKIHCAAQKSLKM